jgi:hypothetical protein
MKDFLLDSFIPLPWRKIRNPTKVLQHAVNRDALDFSSILISAKKE